MQLLFSFILNFFPFVYLQQCLEISVVQPELVILLPQPQGFMSVPLGVRVVLFLSVFPL